MFDCHFKRLSSARGSVAQLILNTSDYYYCTRVVIVGGKVQKQSVMLRLSPPRWCDVANFLRLVASSDTTVRLQTTNHTSTMSTHTTTTHSISFYLDLPQSTVRQPSNGHIKHLTRSRTTEDSRFVLAEWAQSAMSELWTVHREDEMSVRYSRENSSPWLSESVCLHKLVSCRPSQSEAVRCFAQMSNSVHWRSCLSHSVSDSTQFR